MESLNPEFLVKTLLAALPEKGRDTLLAAAEAKTLPVGETLFQEGALGREVYLVVTGELEVLKAVAGSKARRVGVIAPGELFGEMALFENEPRSATVRAKTESRVLLFRGDTLASLLDGHPEIAAPFYHAILKKVCLNLKAANQRSAQTVIWGLSA